MGSDHIIIARRYRALGALNDLFIAVWFLTGSILFFFDSLMTGGTWLFVVGSLQLLLRPAITLAELVHVKRIDQHPQNLSSPLPLYHGQINAFSLPDI